MRFLLLAALLLPASANAQDRPWFDMAAAEAVVAQTMPAYFEHIAATAATDPSRYQNKLHQALVMTLQGENYPELIDAWNRKWESELRFRALAAEWRVASPNDQAALREEMLALALESQQAQLDLFQIKYVANRERLDRLELQIADTEVNLDLLALERVMKALDE